MNSDLFGYQKMKRHQQSCLKKNYSINSVLLVAWKTGFIDVVSSYAKDEAVLSDVFFDKDYKSKCFAHSHTSYVCEYGG